MQIQVFEVPVDVKVVLDEVLKAPTPDDPPALTTAKIVAQAMLVPKETRNEWIANPHKAGAANLTVVVLAQCPMHQDRVDAYFSIKDGSPTRFVPEEVWQHLESCVECKKGVLNILVAMIKSSIES